MAFIQVTSNLDMFSTEHGSPRKQIAPTNQCISYTLIGVITQSIPRRQREESEACSIDYVTGTVSAAVKKRLGYKKPTMPAKSCQYMQQHVLQYRI